MGCAGAPPPPPAAPAAAQPEPPSPAPEQACTNDTPHDFVDELQTLWSLVTCAGDDAVGEFDATARQRHCRALRPMIDAHRRDVVAVAKPFLAGITAGAPKRVVYPFSGGDLLTALTTYPKADEITTISLELPGDPRVRVGVHGTLDAGLTKVRELAGELLGREHYSRSTTLSGGQLGAVPNTLSLFLIGLAVHDLEPRGLRYFELKPDGSIRYLSRCAIEARAEKRATRRRNNWLPPDFSEAFTNVELRFGPRGRPDAPTRVHRHIAHNLHDDALASTSPLLRHLRKKGRVAAMTKAASYLLWRESFSVIRGHLADYLAIMVSDSTGIPPAVADEHGLEQTTYGVFSGSLLAANPAHNRAFRKRWKSQPKRPLPFRFGYLSRGQRHLLVTRRKVP